MVSTKNYQAFGFHFSSPIECPAIPVTSTESSVQIRYGEVPEQLSKVRYSRNSFQAGPNNLLLNFKSVGKFWVKNGNHIIIHPREETNPEDIRQYLLGSAFAGLLYQRGFLVLHATAINLNKGAVLVVGQSGAGKSTLACAFHQQDQTVLTDDLCALKIDSNGKAYVYTGFRQIKINRDTAESMGIPKNAIYPLGGSKDKLGFKLPIEHLPVKTPLQAIFGLQVGTGDKYTVSPLTSKEKTLQLLFKHTFRKHFIKGFGEVSGYLHKCQLLSKSIPFYQISRPEDGNFVQTIIDQIYMLN